MTAYASWPMTLIIKRNFLIFIFNFIPQDQRHYSCSCPNFYSFLSLSIYWSQDLPDALQSSLSIKTMTNRDRWTDTESEFQSMLYMQTFMSRDAYLFVSQDRLTDTQSESQSMLDMQTFMSRDAYLFVSLISFTNIGLSCFVYKIDRAINLTKQIHL